MIIGHERILRFFDEAVSRHSLAHAYCFIGADQVGKRTVARYLASRLLGVLPEKLDHHPDFIYVERREDEKTGKLKKDVSVSQARELRERLGRRSWLGQHQVVILDEAERLNDEAANALLKTLEEPAAGTVVILLTDNDQVLLPTIRSRVQPIYFSLVPDKQVVAGLEAGGVNKTLAAEVVRLASGRPGRAKQLSEQEELRANYEKEVKRFNRLIGQPFYTKLAAIEDLFGDKEDAVRGRERLSEVIDLWLTLWREALLAKLALPIAESTVAAKQSPEQITKIMDMLLLAKIDLRRNIHPRLVVEHCVLPF